MTSLSVLIGSEQLEITGALPQGLHPKDFVPQMPGDKHAAALACNGRLFLRQFGSQDLLRAYAKNVTLRDHVDWIQTFDIVLLQLPWISGVDALGSTSEFWAEALLPHQRLIVRTSTIGHEGTGSTYQSTWNASELSPLLAQRPHHAPFRGAKELVDFFESTQGHKSWKYTRSEQDLGVEAFQKVGATIVDIFYFSAMMWDRHKDPLHYCIPGPWDLWSEVLFNLLVRGHLRDYDAWAAELRREVDLRGGLRNKDGVEYEKGFSDRLFRWSSLDSSS